MQLRLLALVVAALALVGLPLALAEDEIPGVDKPVSANLDLDPELEQVVPEEVCEKRAGKVRPADPPCTEREFSRRRIVLEDTCDGKPYSRKLSTVQDYVDSLRVTDADGSEERPEIFYWIRSGAAGRGGEARVVRWEGDEAGACPQAYRLFRYPTRATLGKIPRGAIGRAGFSVFLRDFEKRYPGKEVRVFEPFVDRNDSFCCPSFERITDFRFSRPKDGYVAYRTRVRRIG